MGKVGEGSEYLRKLRGAWAGIVLRRVMELRES